MVLNHNSAWRGLHEIFSKNKPGMGDAYWYEWSVGQQYIIDMLNPDNNIKCVELQANVKLGLDDVVVTYEGGEKLFVLIKKLGYVCLQIENWE